jgi:predicted NBD/HSP70 family sugar kinase
MRVGVDLGGSKTRIAAFPDSAKPTFTEIVRLDTLPDYDAHLAQMFTAIQSVGQIDGVGLGVGVQMSKDGARIDVSYTMPGFEGKPIVADLSAALGYPVIAMNENIFAVLAERKFGDLGRFDRCAYLTVSTGTAFNVATNTPSPLRRRVWASSMVTGSEYP